MVADRQQSLPMSNERSKPNIFFYHTAGDDYVERSQRRFGINNFHMQSFASTGEAFDEIGLHSPGIWDIIVLEASLLETLTAEQLERLFDQNPNAVVCLEGDPSIDILPQGIPEGTIVHATPASWPEWYEMVTQLLDMSALRRSSPGVN